jgi:hypothetical protein
MELFKDYGGMTLPQVWIPVLAYQVTMDCHTQNDYQLYIAFTISVDEDTKGKMQCQKLEIMTGAAGDIPSGMLYFKKLMMKAEVDFLGMASQICNNLRSLDTSMYTTATATY